MKKGHGCSAYSGERGKAFQQVFLPVLYCPQKAPRGSPAIRKLDLEIASGKVAVFLLPRVKSAVIFTPLWL